MLIEQLPEPAEVHQGECVLRQLHVRCVSLLAGQQSFSLGCPPQLDFIGLGLDCQEFLSLRSLPLNTLFLFGVAGPHCLPGAHRCAQKPMRQPPAPLHSGVLIAILGDPGASNQFHHEVRPARLRRARLQDFGNVRMIH